MGRCVGCQTAASSGDLAALRRRVNQVSEENNEVFDKEGVTAEDLDRICPLHQVFEGLDHQKPSVLSHILRVGADL